MREKNNERNVKEKARADAHASYRLALVMGIFSSDLRMRKSKQETTQLKIKH